MQIDLVNWLEITAAAVALICCFIHPSKSLAILAVLLCITVSVEFASKYLGSQYKKTLDLKYVHLKVSIYGLYNVIKYSCYLWLMYVLLKDKPSLKMYAGGTAAITLFVLANIAVGQGYKVYNNYSSAFGTLILVAVALYKLRTFNEEKYNRLELYTILTYLFLCIFYFAVNLPFFLFFHQMIAKDAPRYVFIYRLINDGANFVLYPMLTIIALMLVLLKSSRKPHVQFAGVSPT